MKYFYIVCLALSSFFTYKLLNAAEQYQQYAIFVPRGTFLQNTSVEDINENNMRELQKKKQNSEKISLEITLPYVRKKVKVIQPQKKLQEDVFYEKPRTEELEPIHVSRQIIDEVEPLISDEERGLPAYSLSDELSPEEMGLTQKKEVEAKVLSPIEEYAELSIEKMLAKIPFPDSKLPAYKRLYSEYGMGLRVFHRTGKFPYNRDLEETLSKANTIQRFTVE